jgi:hypothetical protein
VYGAANTEDIEPTAASVKFIDRVIDVSLDENQPIGWRVERLENLLAHYLRMRLN